MPHLVREHPNVDAFLAVADAFLAAREAEHNLIYGICSVIRVSPSSYGSGADRPRFWTIEGDGGAVVGASVRTPPWNQVLSCIDETAAVDALATALVDEALPGAVGPTEVAARFAASWAGAAGITSELETHERIHRLDRLVPPSRPAPGAWRIIAPHDRDLLAVWIPAFITEAEPAAPPVPDPIAVADRWVAQEGRIGYVWEDGGEVVCFVGAGGETPNGIRIGPVYTPPERRGRGYATSLTAAATRDQLDRGRRFVFLFTDLGNPTSNRIYRAIGYRPVVDVDVHRFHPRG